MEITQAIVLALVQGITEFLPISSSAHLVITSELIGWRDQGLAFDLGIHLGTLLAVICYFWRDLLGYKGILFKWREHHRWHEFTLLVVASIPAAVIGLAFAGLIEQNLRSLTIIIIANTFFALVLWYADWVSRRRNIISVEQTTYLTAILIGLAQATALIPGTSRSGVTISASLLLGMTRTAAARFSFLLSIPIIFGGSLFIFTDLMDYQSRPDVTLMALSIIFSFATAIACISMFMRFILSSSLLIFVVYRLLLSLLLAYLVWG